MMKILYSISAVSFSSLLLDTGADGIPIWLWRAFVSLCLLIIAYFIKKGVADTDKNNDRRDEKIAKLLVITAAHEVMYQIWLEEITSGNPMHPEDGRRKTDRVYKILTQIAENNDK
jgi:hypothetical protein